MKKGLTEIVFILDKSGSMHGFERDTVGGFNSLIEKQRSEEGEALVSTVFFSTHSEVIHDRVPLARIEPLTVDDFRVGGCTALFDAVGSAIHHIGNVHKYARAEDVPEHTIFVISTDGFENASRCHGRASVRKMIEKMKTKYDWEFIFLGANIDAQASAAEIGIDADCSVQFDQTHDGIIQAFREMDVAVSSCRRRPTKKKEED